MAGKKPQNGKINAQLKQEKNFPKDEYLLGMRYAQTLGKDTPLPQILSVLFFGAFVILIVSLHMYTRPMDQFAWSSSTSTSTITDLFSFGKAVAIVVCAIVALCSMALNAASQSMAIKRTAIYIPMVVYSFFVILSYICSDLKEFAIWGWNDRFEGTIPILSYMVMLFYIINAINSERNVKQVVGCLGVSSAILSLLGLSQGTGHDFFQTTLGQKLLTLFYSDYYWDAIDQAAAEGETYFSFSFQNNEIYQTVYNINYVSFYLTLLIPLFGMLFIYLFKDKTSALWKKIACGVIFGLIVYNFIGSASSGGFMGLAVAIIVAIPLLAKHLKSMLKPLGILFAIAAIVFGITYNRWLPELKIAFGSLNSTVAVEESTETDADEVEAGSVKPYLDYIINKETYMVFSVNGNELYIYTQLGSDGQPSGAVFKDSDGNILETYALDDETFAFKDERFYAYVTGYNVYTENDAAWVILFTAGSGWPFALTKTQTYYQNILGNYEILDEVESVGFENHYNFGSGRGGIWALTIPLFKDRIFIGSGADTFCGVFPNNAYANKYNHSETGAENIVYDKPHNMYFGTIIGTGVISLIAQLAIFVLYIIQSIKVFKCKVLDGSYLSYIAMGIFLGVIGFLVTGIVDDSTVSVMPMFYTLLGTGVAVNGMLKHKYKQQMPAEEK